MMMTAPTAVCNAASSICEAGSRSASAFSASCIEAPNTFAPALREGRRQDVRRPDTFVQLARSPWRRGVGGARKAGPHVSDDAPNLLARQPALEGWHLRVELLAALRDAPEQVFVDRDRPLDHVCKQRRRGEQRPRGVAVTHPLLAVAGR